MTNLEFFQSLDYEDGLRVATKTFDRFSLQYGTTLGLDGNPQIRPIEFKFAQDGVLYGGRIGALVCSGELRDRRSRI